jgi:DNA-binding GntR family transcriptional regulator
MMKPRRSEQLREALAEQIATGAYVPGQRLDEAQLAARFGASRTPLREALIQLAADGLIEIRPRRGAVVRALEPQRLVEMFEVMAELEAMCARLAARRISPTQLAQLRAAHQRCAVLSDQADDLDAYYHANQEFHFALYEASQNQFLCDEAKALHRKLGVYRRLQLRVRDRVNSSFREHAAVLDALQLGDGERAATEVRAHVAIQGERFTDLLASLALLKAA